MTGASGEELPAISLNPTSVNMLKCPICLFAMLHDKLKMDDVN